MWDIATRHDTCACFTCLCAAELYFSIENLARCPTASGAQSIDRPSSSGSVESWTRGARASLRPSNDTWCHVSQVLVMGARVRSVAARTEGAGLLEYCRAGPSTSLCKSP